MSATTFQLSRLYHRPGVGDAVGELVAASNGLTRVHWDEFRRLAPLLPPAPQEHPQGSIGIFRGQTVDFILAHAHLDSAGKPGVQYVVLTADALRQAAGRVGLLQQLLRTSLPDPLPETLPPLEWVAPDAPTAEAQVDDLSSFTFTLNDKFAIIDDLLGALIQGIPIMVTHAPGDLEKRLGFVQGLLTLLPVPARFGVSFATYVRRYEAAPVQIAFLAGDAPPEGSLCYDWEAGALSGPRPEEDPYSRFIMQQLRLDPTVAVEQMVALTRTAGWRMTRQESLAQALGWAAKRVALDAAVTEGLPADSDMVAAVLREDPTLSDELRVRYARHLLAFTLALEEPEPADVIALQARAHDDVAQAVLGMLDDAIREGKAYLVYRLIARWVENPAGPEGSNWQKRAYAAASAYLQTQVALGNSSTILDFLTELQSASENLMLAHAVPELLETVLPVAGQSPELAQTLFLLAADHLPAAPFQRLARMGDFTRQLPQAFQQGVQHFQPAEPPPAPSGLLPAMAGQFGTTWSLVVLARLVEWIIALERPDVIDTPTLEQLVALVRSPWQGRFATILRHVVEDLSRSDVLVGLAEPGPRYLVEILLQLGDYRQVVSLLEQVSRTRFRGDAQAQFGAWVSSVFEQTSLETADILEALDALVTYDLKPVPCAMAYRGALINRKFDAALEPVSMKLTRALCNQPHIVPQVGYEVALRLVQSHARRQDAENAVLLAAEITNSLAGREEGLAVVGRLWTMLNWNKALRESALELLRRYVRQVPLDKAESIPDQIGSKLGNRVEEMLRATVVMNALTGGEDFITFAESLHVAAELLTDIQAAYNNKPYPTLHRLRSDLDSMSGGVSEQEREQIAADLLAIGRLAYTLGDARGRGRNRPSVEKDLLAGKIVPKSAVDALLWIGGNLSGGETIQPNLDREAMQHIFAHRSVNMLRGELQTVRRLLEQAQRAFPPGKAPKLTVQAFLAEVESQWKGLRLYDQQQIKGPLATDAQTLAALLGILADKGDEKALNDSGLGRNLETAKREPRSGLEAVRLLYGYFARL